MLIEQLKVESNLTPMAVPVKQMSAGDLAVWPKPFANRLRFSERPLQLMHRDRHWFFCGGSYLVVGELVQIESRNLGRLDLPVDLFDCAGNHLTAFFVVGHRCGLDDASHLAQDRLQLAD